MGKTDYQSTKFTLEKQVPLPDGSVVGVLLVGHRNSRIWRVELARTANGKTKRLWRGKGFEADGEKATWAIALGQALEHAHEWLVQADALYHKIDDLRVLEPKGYPG